METTSRSPWQHNPAPVVAGRGSGKGKEGRRERGEKHNDYITHSRSVLLEAFRHYIRSQRILRKMVIKGVCRVVQLHPMSIPHSNERTRKGPETEVFSKTHIASSPMYGLRPYRALQSDQDPFRRERALTRRPVQPEIETVGCLQDSIHGRGVGLPASGPGLCCNVGRPFVAGGTRLLEITLVLVPPRNIDLEGTCTSSRCLPWPPRLLPSPTGEAKRAPFCGGRPLTVGSQAFVSNVLVRR